MKACVKKLKKDGYFLVYLYYNFEDRGSLFKNTFFIVNLIRKFISKLPNRLKKILTDIIALSLYFPLSRLSKLHKFVFKGKSYMNIPLSYYHDKSFFVMRNDSFDRFGTPLEQRFSKSEIYTMMKNCGLTYIVFSEKSPFWHAIGKKK